MPQQNWDVFSLISPAYAQTVGGGTGAGGFNIMQLLPWVLILGVMYFLLIRPQQKRAKEHKDMVTALRRGDRVVTSGGLIGTVQDVDDENEISVQVGDGVVVRVLRSSVTQLLAKTEPHKTGSVTSRLADASKAKKTAKKSSGKSASTTKSATATPAKKKTKTVKR